MSVQMFGVAAFRSAIQNGLIYRAGRVADREHPGLTLAPAELGIICFAGMAGLQQSRNRAPRPN
jgi:hypothetical protein